MILLPGFIRGIVVPRFLPSAVLFALSNCLSPALAAEITHPKTVVELFTSQGCYSCPPADKVIARFSQEDDILGISWHVDYWDYLGWKDTFASKANTQRQYAYARTLKERQVYTPQAIINGRSHMVGSHENEIRQISKRLWDDRKGMIVPLDVDLEDDKISISIAPDASAKDSTLYLVLFNKKSTVSVKNGENGGKKLDYHNVVGGVQALGMVKADGLQMQYPVSEIKRTGFDACAILLQKTDKSGNPGAIIGVVEINGL